MGGDEAVVSQNTIFGQFLRGGRNQGADTRTLKAIADGTGGKFYEARDARALGEIYREIDELERSEIESLRFMDYKELFLPFAIAAFLVLALETALNCTLFRKIP